MITRLDIYILKKFSTNLLASIGGWIVLFIVINMIEKIAAFIDYNATLSQFLMYYVYFIPQIIHLTLPIAVLIAVLFAVSALAQNNEIVAQLSAGVSLNRILFPLFIGGIIISVLAGLFSEYVVPPANQKRLNLYNYEIKNAPRNSGLYRTDIFVQDANNRTINIKTFNGQRNEGTQVSIQRFSGAHMVERIDAKKIIWQDNKWLLRDVRMRSFVGEDEKIRHLKDTVITDSQIKPVNIVRVKKKPEEMSYAELNVFIDELNSIGANPRTWIVERHLKIALPFANFIVVLIGAPFASRKRRGGAGLSFGISLLISFAFFIIIRIGQVLGHQGSLEPLLAAWLGNIIFFLIGLYFLFSVRK